MSKITLTQQGADVPNPSTNQQSVYAKGDERYVRNPTGAPKQLTNPQDVTPAEAAAGTEVANRTFSPADIKTAIDALAPGASNLSSFTIQADCFEHPNNADWKVNAAAPLGADSNNNSLTVRRFDDTTEEGVGFLLAIPTGRTQMKVCVISRAETAPGGAKNVAFKLYAREIPDNAAVAVWDAGTTWADMAMPANEFFQVDIETKTLAALGYTAGKLHQFQLTRVDATVDDLVGDWALLQISVEFI